MCGSVESLRRLHAKSRTIDGYLDDRTSQGSTARQAWREIRDNVERGKHSMHLSANKPGTQPHSPIPEADARQAFVAMLHTTISPLLQLRVCLYTFGAANEG